MSGRWSMASVLAHPRWPWIAALAGVLLASPALWAGLQLDDHLHRFAVGRHAAGEAIGAWWDLYVAAEGDEALTRARMDHGYAPWWTVPELRTRFLRPLAAATHYVEYAAWPDAPWLMHAHSLVWYAALVVMVGRLLRRWLGPTWVAGLATLIFAVDDAHGMPVGWIAQRNALISATFTVSALWAHDRARRDDWRPGRWWGPGFLLLGLAAGEAAVTALGYLVAQALGLEPGGDRGRRGWARAGRGVLALWPYVAIVVAWRVGYDALGYGAEGSGVYLDPGREPAAFFGALPDRAAALGLLQLGPRSAQAWAAQPSLELRAGAALAMVAFGLCLVPGRRQAPGPLVGAVGAALALIPAATAAPHDRLLLLVGVGASAALAGIGAVAVGSVGRSAGARSRWDRAARWLAIGLSLPLAAVHLVGAAWSLPRVAGGLGDQLERPQREAVRSLPADPGLAEQELVIVNSPPTFLSSTLWLWRWGGEAALPRRLRVLGSTFGPVVVRRSGARSLELLPVGGYFGDPFTAQARGSGRPFSVGERVELDGWTVSILGVTEGRPTAVRISFSRSLDDPAFRWVTWTGGRFVPFVPPAVGASVALPGGPPP